MVAHTMCFPKGLPCPPWCDAPRAGVLEKVKEPLFKIPLNADVKTYKKSSIRLPGAINSIAAQ